MLRLSYQGARIKASCSIQIRAPWELKLSSSTTEYFQSHRLTAMVDPIGVSLGAIGLIQPAIQTCYQAYKLYKLTEDFGEDYRSASRKLNRQWVMLDELSKLKLSALVLG